MRTKIAALSVLVLMGAAASLSQEIRTAPKEVTAPDYNMVNCSGFVTDRRVSEEFRLISGEQSNYKLTWTSGDYVYINRGQDKGVRVGDRFSVVRVDDFSGDTPWFKWQDKLMKAMGTQYIDAGQVRVVNVHPKVSIAQIIFSCDYMQRGDIVLPYQERPIPPFKEAAAFDHFAPVSGKPVAMVVAGKDHSDTFGKNSPVYVNLGANQGVKVGDYFRIFRYQGSAAETVPQTKDYQFMMYGFGSAPQRYGWNDLPREILGEGIVFNVSRNSSTMMVTVSSGQIYAGDYIEIE
jgi:Flagellar assembly protein T, C-terminal domain